jgi:hypothetical protein
LPSFEVQIEAIFGEVSRQPSPNHFKSLQTLDTFKTSELLNKALGSFYKISSSASNFRNLGQSCLFRVTLLEFGKPRIIRTLDSFSIIFNIFLSF